VLLTRQRRRRLGQVQVLEGGVELARLKHALPVGKGVDHLLLWGPAIRGQGPWVSHFASRGLCLL